MLDVTQFASTGFVLVTVDADVKRISFSAIGGKTAPCVFFCGTILGLRRESCPQTLPAYTV
jgi:hypothetical protein